MPKILSSIACNLDANVLLASIPLFESEKVQAIEWSFDTLFSFAEIPSWFTELVSAFGAENRLIGHGVYFSLFSGKWSKEQADWLIRLGKLCSEYRFDHITEHFGFMTGADFHQGAPLSIPYTSTTLRLGIDRLKRIQAACNCSVGLENLAFSYSIEEVKRHGDFLNELVEPINGFIILDLHNLYCQIHNFDLDFAEIIQQYPLHRVREIHISGGSWEASSIIFDKKVRRDTHDDAVPEVVFELLKKTMPMCSSLKYVVMEQLGTGLNTEGSRQLFQKDFYVMDALIDAQNKLSKNTLIESFLPKNLTKTDTIPFEDAALLAQQMQLSNILETATDYHHAQQMLAASNLKNSAWGVEQWQPYMLETAIAIAQKWAAEK